jgi:hypothetical protein
MNPIALPILGDKLNMAASEEIMMQAIHMMVGGTVNQDELIAMMFEQYPTLNTTDVMERTLTMTDLFTEWFFETPANWEAVQHFRLVRIQ